MLGTLIRKELMAHVLTFRFVIGTVFSIVLFLASALVLTSDYGERVEAYQAAAARHREAIGKAKVFARLEVEVDRPPEPLSLICRGADAALPRSSSFSILSAPTIEAAGASRNPLMAVFQGLDLASVVQIVMSLLAMLFAYDAVSGERERGTLALALSNPISRASVLLGKYLGGLAVLVPLLLIGTGLSLAVMLSSPLVQLSGSDWLVIAVMTLVSIAYLSVCWLVGLTVSVLTRWPHTSLVVVLFLWVVFVLLLPQAASATAAGLRPLASQRDQAASERQLITQAREEIYRYARQHPVPISVQQQRFNVERSSVLSGGVPLLGSLYSGPREYVDWAVDGTRATLPLLIEAENRIQGMRLGSVRERAAQAGLARRLRRISPAALYYDSSASLAGSDYTSYLKFVQLVGDLRHRLIDFAAANDGLGVRFFTRPEALELPGIAELEELESQGQDERIKQLMGEGFDSEPPLNVGDIGLLDVSRTGPARRIASVWLDMVVLAIMNIVLILIASICFSRADVRAG